MRRLIFIVFLFLSPSLFSQGIADYDAVRVRSYFIYNNDSNRTASTADSILGFIGGSDIATLIPIPSGGGSGDTSYFDLAGNVITTKAAIDEIVTDTVTLGSDADNVDGVLRFVASDGDEAQIYITADDHIKIDGFAQFWFDGSKTITGTSSTRTILGCNALGNANYATTIGWSAGSNDVAETSVGYYAGSGSGGGVNIGGHAGRYETGSDRIIIDCINRTNEANSRAYAPFYSVTNATPSSQVTQIGGTGKVGIGTTSPDSLLHVAGGAVVETDILVGGGWTKWTPTFTWTGGTPSAPTSTVARYSVTNNTVEFNMYVTGTNDSGSTLTGLGVTPPIYPPDINAYANVMTTMVIGGTGITTGTRYTSLLDMIDNTKNNRVIKVLNIILNNSQDYEFVITGTYEITGR